VEEGRLSTQIAVARLVLRLAQGQGISSREAGVIMTRHQKTALRCLQRLEGSHCIPVYFDAVDGKWKMALDVPLLLL
jgi:hypothetical protein